MSVNDDCIGESSDNSFDDDSINNDYSYDEENLLANKNNFNIEERLVTPSSKDRVSNLRKAISLSTCALCEANNSDITRNSEGGFSLRRVASCSICTWDLDDKCFEDDFKAVSSDEELTERPVLKRSNSYTRAMSVSSYTSGNEEEISSNKDINANDEKSKTNELNEDNENFYQNQTNMHRSPPDGGECFDIEKPIEKTPEEFIDSPKNKQKKSFLAFGTPKSKKKDKKEKKKSKIKSQNSLDKNATAELDEIFGKIRKTPDQTQSSFDEEDDKFNISNEKFDSAESFASTGKKSKKLLRRLLPPRSIFATKHSNLNHQRSRSVEFLYTNEPYVPDMNLMRSLSSMEMASCGLSEDFESDDFLAENINEKWIAYLNRIGGMTVFGGNESIRYVWHQISCYQNDLLQPFEDFMKTVIEEIQQVYMKCQELEGILTLKTEQQEKETTKLYDDVEQAMQEERIQRQEKHLEKEEQTRAEFVTLLELKEQEMQDLVKSNTELNEKNEKLHLQNNDIKLTKEIVDKQFIQLVASENNSKKQISSRQEEIDTLHQRLAAYDATQKELQDHVTGLTKIAAIEKENYKQCLRRYQDLIEEKEFLDVSINNLSSEIGDLRVQNKYLTEQQNNLSSQSIHQERNVSPELDDTFDENCNPHYYNRAVSPESNSSLTSSASYPGDHLERTPVIQTPNGLTPLRPKLHSIEHSKNILTSSPIKHMNYRNSAQTPIKIASTSQSEFKVIFTGDANVGKTSLIRRITNGKFRANRDVTIEPDYSTKVVEYKGQQVKLKLWDTVGQERFNSIPPAYFRKSDVVILIYDIEEDSSFFNAKTWIKTIHENTNENIFLVLVGNKSDLHHKRKVTIEKGKLLAKNHDAMFVETSAKSGENINVLCEMIASTLLEREDTVVIRNDFESSLCSLNYSMRRQKSKSICCQ